MIIRFAYNFGPIGAEDASKTLIFRHLDKLKLILEDNADVIAVMQAGFIGAWGEWHSSTRGLDTTEDCRDILFKILDTLPPSRMVQITGDGAPNIKREIFEGQTITEDDAFEGSHLSRNDFHSECFLSGATDASFYLPGQVEEMKSYLTQDCRFVPMGGETGRVSAWSHCSNVLADLEQMHWSYLGGTYHEGVLSIFESEGSMPEISRRLGYWQWKRLLNYWNKRI